MTAALASTIFPQTTIDFVELPKIRSVKLS